MRIGSCAGAAALPWGNPSPEGHSRASKAGAPLDRARLKRGGVASPSRATGASRTASGPTTPTTTTSSSPTCSPRAISRSWSSGAARAAGQGARALRWSGSGSMRCARRICRPPTHRRCASVRHPRREPARGVANLLGDVQRGRISQTDERAFEVGRNLAVTPGEVVFENELDPAHPVRAEHRRGGERPLVMIPPCINKFYILDLQPENSFVAHAVASGHTVFMVSWRNVDARAGPAHLGRLPRARRVRALAGRP